MANSDDVFYNIDRNEKDKHMCCLCECLPEIHAMYWNCPIFNGEKICVQCCHIEAMKNDIDEKFSKALGRPITKKEINEHCKKCKRNHAIQDEGLAIDLENNNIDTGGNDETEQGSK